VNNRAFRDASEKQELWEVHEIKLKERWEGTIQMIMMEGQHFTKQVECYY